MHPELEAGHERLGQQLPDGQHALERQPILRAVLNLHVVVARGRHPQPRQGQILVNCLLLDRIGALNDWLQLAPQAQPVCTQVGKLVSVDDFSIGPAFGMTADDVLVTGRYRYRFHRSPHIPHGWDAGVLFEETRRTLFCRAERD